jgi:hypothetical protein
MRAFAIASTCLLGIASAFACGGSTTSPHGTMGAPCDPCDGGGSSGIASPTSGHNVNPDGVAYPAPPGGYGRNARAGATPGSVIQNFKFLGYPDPTNVSAGLQTVSLADYYDPCQKRYKLLHITVAGVWCGPCNMETDAIVAAKQQLATEKIVVLQALDDGPVMGEPATQANLDYWVTVHHPTFPETLDPGLHNLGGFFDANAIPWNADVDVRTMEILTSAVGAEDPTTDFAVPLALVTPVAGNPTAGKPGYQVAVTCP